MNHTLLISQEIQPSITSANTVFIQNLIKALAHLDFAAIEQLVQTLDEGQGFGYSNKWEFYSFTDNDEKEEDKNREPDYLDIHSTNKYEFLASMQRLIQNHTAKNPELPLVVENATCYGCQKENPCSNNQIYSFIDKSIIPEFSPVLFSFNLESNTNGDLISVSECRYAMPNSLINHPALQYLYTADWERDMLPF